MTKQFSKSKERRIMEQKKGKQIVEMMWGLFCDGNLCGFYTSEDEAREVANEISSCTGMHQIKKTEVSYYA